VKQVSVLVTGGSGFIGHWTLKPLAQHGFDVHIAARRPWNGGIGQFHSVDLLDANESEQLIARLRPTHILHCAWDVTHGRFWDAPKNLDWVAATLRLARAFASYEGRRFVGVGTCAEYDWSDSGARPRREDDLLRPTSLYGQAKASTAAVLQAFFSIQHISFAWARMFHLFGPGEAPGRLVASVARALIMGDKAVCGAGNVVRDFMPVEQAGAALAMLIESGVQGPVNVATGRGTSVETIAHLLGEISGRPDLVAMGALPAAVATPSVMTADVTRLRQEVGFNNVFGLREALMAAMQYWRVHELR
jgi:nucleoside-diphosphate-sugar epimerase